MEVAWQKLSLQLTLYMDVANAEAAAQLTADGIVLHDWSAEDRAMFRSMAQEAWADWATRSPEAAALVDSHVEYMTVLGLIN